MYGERQVSSAGARPGAMSHTDATIVSQPSIEPSFFMTPPRGSADIGRSAIAIASLEQALDRCSWAGRAHHLADPGDAMRARAEDCRRVRRRHGADRLERDRGPRGLA